MGSLARPLLHRPRRAPAWRLATALPLACALAACGREPAPSRTLDDVLAIELTDELRASLARMSPLPPLQPDPTNRVADDPRAAHYGRFLFFDERLSRNGEVACATCHAPDKAFSDGRSLAFGIALGTRRTPTLWNAAHHRWLTWDGRADSLWMQALDPLEDPREMDATRLGVARVVASDPAMREAHEAIFGPLPEALDPTRLAELPHRARPARAGDEGVPEEVAAWAELAPDARAAADRVFVEVGKSLAAYQRRLVRGDAPFDRFARGVATGDAELAAELSPAAQRGLALFLGRASCVMCHSGPNFSDGEFHNNSLPTLDGGATRDEGRYRGAAVVKESPFNSAGEFSDDREGAAARAVRLLRSSSETWGEFRTPSLRNLAGREPFMHEGQLADLPAVLEFYSTLDGSSGRNHHQERILVPLALSAAERADLTAFLASLEGAPADEGLLRPPEAPLGPAEHGSRIGTSARSPER